MIKANKKAKAKAASRRNQKNLCDVQEVVALTEKFMVMSPLREQQTAAA
ncbi:MAG: hypothetical protein PHO37_18480 [Kiritimatiellae bacterium]|nr:hypothetical protein [Kiritimatiellia bacterium]